MSRLPERGGTTQGRGTLRLRGRTPPAREAVSGDTPGSLRGAVSLHVQSRAAARLIHGRARSAGKAAIVGLVHFARLMGEIWQCALRDDPYADWTLIRVLECLEAARAEMRTLHARTRTQLQALPGVEITVAQSLCPVEVPLAFANAFGYRAAYLIAEYDALVCALLTARHVGVLGAAQAGRDLNRGAALVRRVLAAPLVWKRLEVCREDVRQDTERARQARERMGVLPPEVLAGTRRCPLLPAAAGPPGARDAQATPEAAQAPQGGEVPPG